MAKCCSTCVMSLPVWMSIGDDTEAILGASNLKRLSCRSFHLILIMLLQDPRDWQAIFMCLIL